MGALAPVTPWIPEDDLLLKNAVEAGASLESLAKGAVQFSRRFTIKELQDRWLALLYDPVVSAEASKRIMELERSASTLTSKSKEMKGGHGKRKVESVRKCYYAMRKRVCSEPLNQNDFSYLVPQGDNCFISGAEAPGADNMLGDAMAGHFGLEDANFDDLHHAFPQVMRDSAPSCSVGEYRIEQQGPLHDHTEQNIAHKEIPCTLGNNMGVAGSCTRTGLMDPSKELSGHTIFEANDTQASTVCSSKDIMCSGFGENTIFNSPISDCEMAFHHLQYTSSPPALPDWKTIEGMSLPELPDNVSIRGNIVQTGDPFGIPEDGNVGERSSVYDVIHTEPQLNNHMSCDDLKNSTGSAEGYLRELSVSLLHFTSEDEMLMNGGGKDVIGNAYLDGLNLLLNSPEHVSEDKVPTIPETKEPAAAHACLDIPISTCPEQNNITGDTNMGSVNLENNSETQMPASTASVNPQFPELCDGAIFCTLNTEDPEIPCNDDIVFPSKPRPASVHRRTQNVTNNPSLHGKDNARTQTTEKGLSTVKREPKRFGESHAASHTQGPDVGYKHSVDQFGVKFDTSGGEALKGSRNSSTGYGGLCQSSLALKKEPTELSLVRPPGRSVAEKPGQVSDIGHLQTGIGGINQEVQTPSTIRNQEFYALGAVDAMAAEAGGESLLSDPEEQFSESDTDIPYFSDIESMILDMDLGPDDQDSFRYKEVAKYQHEDAKRAIIRLEQNSHSYMHRAIASHGAFAILYGRHSKHYIKKPEVLLGRATEDVSVDIDLGREGHANKISRRQAIIKMDKDGTFHLKNLGKCPVYVNGKEIFPGKSLGLHSSYLIEIRGMPFIFETYPARVKQCLDNAAHKLEDKGLNS